MIEHRQHLKSTAARTAAMAVASFLVLFGVQAIAAQPEVAEILEPAVGVGPLNPADIHMVAEFSDEDVGDEHVCSDWQIRLASTDEAVWRADCAGGAEKTHIHLGDGEFAGPYDDAGRDALEHETAYYLWVRFKDDSEGPEEWSDPKTRPFETAAPHPPGSESEAWQAREGFVVEKFAEGFQLPVNIAMVPDPGDGPADPLMYVAELYGNVKVILRDGTVRDYASGLLNFNPTGDFPGSGEIGLAGIVVEPETGDLFVSMMYEEGGKFHPKIVRLLSDDHGFEATNAAAPETVLYMSETVQGASHQISNLTISPDGNLFVHNGDGGSVEGANQAPDEDSFLGKILRMTLDGKPLPDNPFFTDDGEPFTARDYVYAKGFRNPFGGAWRLSDGTHWEVENGPSRDRLAKVEREWDYGWPGDQKVLTNATYNWEHAHAPVNIDFIEAEKFDGSGFPNSAFGHAFVTESGPTYASGPQANGKAVVEFGLGTGGELLSGPEALAEYVGIGRATAVGLAAGPGGLYFTDLYKDTGAASPIERGANVLRIRYCGAACPRDAEAAPADTANPVPRIGRFKSARKVFAVGLDRRAKGHAGLAAARHGTAFLYRLSEPARVWIGIRPVARGWRLSGRGSCRLYSKRARQRLRRRVGLRRCVLPEARGVRRAGKCRRGSWRRGRGLIGRTRCVIRFPRGVIRGSGRAGTNARPYAGRLQRRPLRPGRYLAVVRARDAANQAAVPRYTAFRVVRGQ